MGRAREDGDQILAFPMIMNFSLQMALESVVVPQMLGTFRTSSRNSDDEVASASAPGFLSGSPFLLEAVDPIE